jgi:Flp pilus assembly protein TadG
MRLRAHIGRLSRCRRGSIAVSTALSLPVLFGVAAFAIDVSAWYFKARSMQGAADAAAISAVAAYLNGDDPVTEGKTYAGNNGWTDGSNGVTVTITPSLAASPAHINADIVQTQLGTLSQLVHFTTLPTITAHARVNLVTVAAVQHGCLIGLKTNASGGAIQISGQGYIDAPTCAIGSNINTATQATNCLNVNPPCLTFPSNPSSGVSIGELDVATRAPFVCPTTGNATCIIGTIKTTYPLWTRDPFASRVLPAASACPGSDPAPTTSATGVKTYTAGTYCQGISISGSSTNVVFQSGVYFLGGTNNTHASSLSVTGGAINQTTVSSGTVSTAGTGYKKNDTLTVSGGAFLFATTIKVSTVNGSGGITAFTVTSGAYTSSTPANPASVTGGAGTGAKFNLVYAQPGANTFVLTGPTAATIGSVSISNAAITLISPATGATAGLVFWQNKLATSGSGLSGNAQSRMKFTGSLYFPNTNVSIAGNASFVPTDCTAIVAAVISITGQGSITNGCVGVGGGGGGSASGYQLVE